MDKNVGSKFSVKDKEYEVLDISNGNYLLKSGSNYIVCKESELSEEAISGYRFTSKSQATRYFNLMSGKSATDKSEESEIIENLDPKYHYVLSHDCYEVYDDTEYECYLNGKPHVLTDIIPVDVAEQRGISKLDPSRVHESVKYPENITAMSLYEYYYAKGMDSKSALTEALDDLGGDVEVVDNVESSLSVLLACLCYAMCVSNDAKHIHIHASGDNFDDIHNIAETIYQRLYYDFDYLCEASLRSDKAQVPNPSKCSEIIGWEYLTATSYDYDTAMKELSCRLIVYLDQLRYLCGRTEDEGIKSAVSEMINYWESEVLYKMNRRLS